MTQSPSSNLRFASAAEREGPAPPPSVSVGKWQLTSLAAEGSWACIYRARASEAPSDGERRPPAYALKMLRPDCQTSGQALGMLAREAQVARQVSHPHLIAIFEAQLKRPPQYLVMPWLEGASLQMCAAGQRSFDPPAVLWIARQAAEAMAALERAGWTHGDIKPSNIFLSPTGHLTLLDLGFAHRRDEPNREPLALAGTGYYLSPEHFIAAGRPDVRSDIYSLGVVLYQLLAGHLPLEGPTLEAMALAHRQSAPLPLRRATPHVPRRVAELVQRMLAKDPLRRPQSPAELVAELVRLEIETFSQRAA